MDQEPCEIYFHGTLTSLSFFVVYSFFYWHLAKEKIANFQVRFSSLYSSEFLLVYGAVFLKYVLVTSNADLELHSSPETVWFHRRQDGRYRPEVHADVQDHAEHPGGGPAHRQREVGPQVLRLGDRGHEGHLPRQQGQVTGRLSKGELGWNWTSTVHGENIFTKKSRFTSFFFVGLLAVITMGSDIFLFLLQGLICYWNDTCMKRLYFLIIVLSLQ